MFIKSFNDVITNHALFSQLIRNTVVVFEFGGGGLEGGFAHGGFLLARIKPRVRFFS